MEAEKWGRRIRAFRKLKGYTQEGFAKELGVSISVIGEIERGNRMPETQLIEQIIDVLHISKNELAPPEGESGAE
ncbi:helix-turn-helix domain-containing protein [Bacillus benzoevorans]|uniref:Transcriptional regulator with XRE-family HTH domain n=1 Tax=Bacillus benzoevorans TaxID=1456 RepID=A0A7X0LX67_9BACI|nr:helix-turn-helix transcriptional regulator [Bacillus benzoevorans]MBB6447448.1 transcriptional regulator with XRE-family HTH domain [Bacillus benzoevorans]